MLRIERASNGKVVYTLIGRIEADDISELHRVFALEGSRVHIVLNLSELLLADRAAVEFLAGCEAKGMTLHDCPGYIRKWIDQGKNKNG